MFCRHFFGSFLTQGETKPCVTIASLFSLNSHKNQHHVQPSRVLRHGNRRATGRTHRNDGARLALLFLFFVSSLSREHHEKAIFFFFFFFCDVSTKREKSLRSALSRSLFYCCDDSFTTRSRIATMDSGTKRRRFIASFLASCAKEVILRTKTERAESPSTGTSSRTKTLRSSTRDQGFCQWPTRGRTRTGRSFSCARRRRRG